MKAPPRPRKGAPTLPGFRTPSDARTLWFSSTGCVVWHANGHCNVLVGGALIGGFDTGDITGRNVLLVLLARDDRIVLEDLARAFGLTAEAVRLVRRRFESGGYDAIIKGQRGRPRKWKISGPLKVKLEACFAKGMNAPQALRELNLEGKLPVKTVRAELEAWRSAQAQMPPGPRQGELLAQVEVTAIAEAEPVAEKPVVAERGDVAASGANESGAIRSRNDESGYALVSADDFSDGRTLAACGPASRRQVQFLGAWLLVAMAARLGLHRAIQEGARDRATKGLRLAIDAVVVALGVGQSCVEGVRRLAHRSAGALLSAARAPSPTWVRGVLGKAAAKQHGFFIQARLSGELIRQATESTGEPAVFYVDNHMRPYTGMRRLLRGWRMQDKRPRPGTTDVHVHDGSGLPLYRVATRMHDSLSKVLLPIGALLRLALGPEQRILLAFDRAASYPEVMSALSKANFEFVAYEKKPFPLLPRHAFNETCLVDGERIHFHEGRKNLGDGRGRVRRIALLVGDGHQVNLLAASTGEASELVAIMAGRWQQENAFKHGVQRWGLNQLDGRSFAPFAPDVVIPSPLRRRLERDLSVLREVEGALRRKLAREPGPAVKGRLEAELARNLSRQRRLEARRPKFPTHCTVEEAGLNGVLMHHRDEYKALLDTIRTACINAEAELATHLAAKLARPREAKRLLQNLFSAPGNIRVALEHVDVSLDVSARSDEKAALEALFRTVNGWKLTLPGDPHARPLRFGPQK